MEKKEIERLFLMLVKLKHIKTFKMFHRKDYHLLFIIQQKTIAHNNLNELRFKIKIHNSKKHNFCGKNTHTDLIFAGVKNWNILSKVHFGLMHVTITYA